MASVQQINGKLYIDGKEVEQPKSIFSGNIMVQINDKVYINGKELINGKWKYTFRSLFHTIFF